MNPVLEKRSQPLPPQHSLRNCWVLVGIQVALEKIRKKNREDFLNGTKEEDFQFLAEKCIRLAKVSPRLATGRWDHQHVLTLVNLRTRCPMSFPLNGSMPGWILPKPIQKLSSTFCGAFAGHTEAPNPWASASLFGTRLGDFSLRDFSSSWAELVDFRTAKAISPCIFLPSVPMEGRFGRWIWRGMNGVSVVCWARNQMKTTCNCFILQPRHSMNRQLLTTSLEVGFRASVHFQDARQVREGYYVQAWNILQKFFRFKSSYRTSRVFHLNKGALN